MNHIRNIPAGDNGLIEYVAFKGRDVMSGYEFIGIAGFLVYVLSFFAVQLSLLDGNSSQYAVLNIFAAFLVLVSLSEAFNLASAMIQISWIAIGLVGLQMRKLRRAEQRETARMTIRLLQGQDRLRTE